MAEIRKILLSIAVAMFSSMLIFSCSSMSTENLEIDPDQFNVNDESPEIADADRLEIDPDRANVNGDSLD
jgi:hypothetical protein